jgi:LPXTG-motif cell wall-anchored protein
MKRQMLMLLTLALVLVAGTALVAQTTGTTQLPPSQQVDQSGKPETGPGPDVDVDTGHNASNGVLDVDVNRHTDSDTAATNDHTMVPTGTANRGTATTGTTGTTGTTYNNDTTTGTNADQSNNLPDTGSEMPLLGLIGLFALAGAATLRASR